MILRLRIALRRNSLDSALARGVDPAGRPQLALRAMQLERPRHRRTLARTLRRVVDDARGPRPAVAVLARKEILAHADDVLELAVRLDCPHPADPAGIALARRLVTDAAASPLYGVGAPSALDQACQQAVAQMGDPYA